MERAIKRVLGNSRCVSRRCSVSLKIGDIVKDAKDSVYVNNVWFIPGERAGTLSGIGAAS